LSKNKLPVEPIVGVSWIGEWIVAAKIVAGFGVLKFQTRNVLFLIWNIV
jgi:hypothetical protein